MTRQEGPDRSALSRLTGAATSRRRFLLAVGASVGCVALAGCEGDDGETGAIGGGAAPDTTNPRLGADLQIACMAASLENLAVGMYSAAISAAQAGRLGTVPPSVMTFAQTAMKQHADHADAWNAILTGAGRTKVSEADLVVKPQIDQGFGQVSDVDGLARLALNLENVAAATYLEAIAFIDNKQALKTAAAIQPVEMQHAAILHYLLGNYPVPDVFARTEGARPPTDCPSS